MKGNYKLVLGVFDAVTARVCSRYADYLWVSSLVMSSMLGLKDDGVVNLENYLPLIKGIASKSKVPVILDFDVGGRNFKEYVNNIKIIKNINLGGVCIEDEKWPKINAMLKISRRLISSNDMSKKIRVAKKLLRNKTLIIARSHSLIINEDIKDIQSRISRYEEAGADVICLHYMSNDWFRFDERMKYLKFNKPLMLILSKSNSLPSIKIVDKLPFKFILFPNQIYRVALKTVINTLQFIPKRKVKDIKFKSKALLNINDFLNIVNTNAK